MDVAVCITQGSVSYNHVFPSNKSILIGGQPNSDLQLPIKDISLIVDWEGNAAMVSVSSREGKRKLIVEQNIPTVVDERLDLTLIVSETDNTEISLDLPENGELFIGRSRKEIIGSRRNDVVIQYPFVSGRHFRIVCARGEYTICDLGSTNGLYCSGVKVSSSKLREGEKFSIFTIQFMVKNGKLSIFNVNKKFLLSHIPHNAECQVVSALGSEHSSSINSFVRSPRLIDSFPDGVIEIEKPPESNGPSSINWLSILVTPAVSIALMVLLIVSLGISPVMLIMSGVMSLLSAFIAIYTYLKQKKKNAAKDSLIYQKYYEYLTDIQERIDVAHEQQIRSLVNSNPNPTECVKIAIDYSQTLWNRIPQDTDFVTVKLGNGTTHAAYYAKYSQQQVVLHETELETRAKQVASGSEMLHNVPILCNLDAHKVTGLIGERIAELALARNILMGLAVTHSCDELKIVVVFPEEETSEWDWVRWLPHCCDPSGEKRYLLFSNNDEEVVAEIEELSRRKMEGAEGKALDAEVRVPHYLFVIAKAAWTEKRQIRKLLFSNDSIGCSALLIYNQITLLPKECSQIIEVNGTTGCIYSRADAQRKMAFSMDKSDVFLADKMSRALAPLQDIAEKSFSLPKTISFLHGYGVIRPDQLGIEERWKNSKTYQTLSVPIASRGGSDAFAFDIHEKFHGVNGIVAGMPGSGKTEMVQSWLLSLAVNYSPQDLSFVLIDFKGTGLIAPFRDIPHLAGAISNLDTNIDRNLQAIQSEVHRREAIIDKYSAKSVKNINDLNKAYAKGFVPEKLPILLIVIDEYAEFKKVFPDFSAEIDSLTSKGRALGMFVVLMTQKPAGVISAKSEDNIKFRWCLRVANYGASREMIGRPDAAIITDPGRCFIKVGEDEVFEEVQSFWSGAPYRPNADAEKKTFVPICTVARNGEKTPCERIEREKVVESNQTEIDVVVQYITDYCKEKGIPNADQVWTPRLPDCLALTDMLDEAFDGKRWPARSYLSPIIGLIDEPANQRQYPMELDFAQCGNTLIYGAPVTGKTTLLQTLVMSLIMRRKPDEASIYIMDFGGWNMGVFREFPHVGGIANDDAPERLKKLVLLINDALQRRKALFSKEGVGNIVAYRQIEGEKLPDIFLIVDNLSTLLKMYPEMEAFFVSLVGSSANYGIYLIATAQAANSIPMKISQNIKNTLALQMIDKSDYTYLVGKVSNPLPQIAGRGLAKGNPPLEFQTALPGPGKGEKAIADFIRREGKLMSAEWQGKRVEPIPEMPKVIPYGTVYVDKVPLGLTTDRIQPVEYDWEKQHFLLISGTPQSGKSNLLYAVARHLKERIGGRLCLFDVRHSAPEKISMIADAWLYQGAQIDSFVENIRPELQKRQAHKLDDNNSHFEPLIIAIDDYNEFFSVVSNETIARLLAIVKIGRGLDLYLIVAGAAYEISALFNKGEAVLLSLGKSKQAVMLGGCMNDHAAVPTNAAFNIKSTKVGTAEGYYTRDSEPTRFKAICYSEEV